MGSQSTGGPLEFSSTKCLQVLFELIPGIDPFNDEDPMGIYQKILKGKIKFPKDFDKFDSLSNRNGKSLVKHLLVADLTKRFGNLKGGSHDVMKHRFFSDIDWTLLYNRKIPSPFKPMIKWNPFSFRSKSDTSNFAHYPDSNELPKPLKASEDPFLNW